MASSSVSQESLDREDDGLYANSADFYARRSRIRLMRAKGTLYKTDRDTCQSVVHENEPTNQDVSPSRLAANRAKDKRRPNNFHMKGKLAKDKRKLREKRRSTGVVHLPSTESTGDSLDEDDEEDCSKGRATPAPATDGCVMPVSHSPSRDVCVKSAGDIKHMPNKIGMNASYHSSSSTCTTSKSPSDADADLEDNQDDGRVQSDEDGRVQSDTAPALDLSQTARIRKQASLESSTTTNGYRETAKKLESVASNPEMKHIGSRVQSLAANFGVKSDKDAKPLPTYSPIGYSGIRRNLDSPRWSPKTQLSPADRFNVSGLGRDADANRASRDAVQPKESTDRNSTSSSSFTRVSSKFSPFQAGNYGKPVSTEPRVPESPGSEDGNKDMKKLKEDNRRLLRLLDDKDEKISQLEKKIAEMEKSLQSVSAPLS